MADVESGTVRRCVVQCCCLVGTLAGLAGGVSAQTVSPPQSVRLNAESARLNNYLNDLAGPGAFISIVGGGLVDHLWKPRVGAGADGMAQKIWSRAGQAAVQVSVRHGLAALMHRSTDYQPCRCHGFGPKVEHALLETFTDRRADGTRALSVPRIAGAYAGDFARLAWDRNHTAGDAVLGTTFSFGFSALFNIARELAGITK